MAIPAATATVEPKKGSASTDTMVTSSLFEHLVGRSLGEVKSVLAGSRLLRAAGRTRSTARSWSFAPNLGAIKTFSSSNCQITIAPNIRLSADLGGGPVGDVGIYSINAARYVTGEEPVEVTAMAHRHADHPRFREVLESIAFTLRFPSGVLAHCDCSFGTAVSRRYRVHCTEGIIDMDPAFDYRGLQLRVKETKDKAATPSMRRCSCKGSITSRPRWTTSATACSTARTRARRAKRARRTCA